MSSKAPGHEIVLELSFSTTSHAKLFGLQWRLPFCSEKFQITQRFPNKAHQKLINCSLIGINIKCVSYSTQTTKIQKLRLTKQNWCQKSDQQKYTHLPLLNSYPTKLCGQKR